MSTNASQRIDDQMEAPMTDDDDNDEGYWCPWCGRDNQTMDQIRECSGFKPTGMPPNETGHPYGCGCSECRSEYQRLK